MKKTGFTLLELVAVIVILGLIGLLVMPLVTNLINDNKQKAYSNQMKNIVDAASLWASSNMGLLPSEEGEVLNITLGNLKASGLVDKNIKNPLTDEYLYNDMKITITQKNGGLKYAVIESSGSRSGEIDLNEVSISLKGLATEIVEAGAQYHDKGVIAINLKGEDIDTIDIYVNNEYVKEVNLTSPGEYNIRYTVVNGSYNDSITRKVIISE